MSMSTNMVMFPFDLTSILDVMKSKGHTIFRDPKGYDVNIVGIRTSDMVSNKFNDWITIFYMLDGKWIQKLFQATTDPGTYYRENPMNVNGTLIIKPGQYRGVYKIGEHRGYTALQQQKNFTVYRDANRDGVLDTEDVDEQEGIFGANIHRASSQHTSTNVDRWSAGCQVFADPDDFNIFMGVCRTAKDLYGNSFTYTLLEEKDF